MRILIVEDEPLVRLGIKSVLAQCGGGFEIAGEAANGKAAMEILAAGQVDLVLCDVKMPVMDGIELARWMAESDSPAKIVMLSGHDDYDYVREAFRYGAIDYVLKHEITEKTFTELFKRLPAPEASGADGGRASSGRVALMLEGKAPIDQDELRKALHGHVDPSADGVLYALAIGFFECGHTGGYEAAFTNMFSEYMKKGYAYALFFDGGGMCVLSLPSATVENELIERLSMLIGALKKYYNIEAVIGMSGRGRLSDMERLCMEAREARGTGFFGVRGAVFHSCLRRPDKRDFAAVKEARGAVMQCAIKGDYANLGKSLGKLRDLFTQRDYTEAYCKKTYSPIIDILGMEFPDEPGDFDMDAVRSYDDLLQKANALAAKAADAGLTINRHVPPPIKECIDYINCNFSDESLSLKTLAGSFGYSGAYLSRLFKKETGRNVVDYINEVRIENAKRMLLDPALKAYRVSETVGYNNYSYFCRVFKKITGLPPSEYIARKQGEAD